MPPTSAWQHAADPARRIGHSVEFHAALGSTNDRARALLSDRAAEGIAVVADLQTAGRGRQGRSWLSPPGLNLMVSVGVRPRLVAANAGQLGLATALAACAACESVTHLLVKWPNDLYTHDGLKVGGILIETTLEGGRLADAVIGLGLNVNWRRAEIPEQVREGATSLADLAGHDLERVQLLASYLAALDAEVKLLEAGVSPVERLRGRSWLDGRRVRVAVPGGEVEGEAAGIADDGALLVRTATATRRVLFGDAVHVTPGAGVAA